MGRGGALSARGSVTPGILGIKGGRLSPRLAMLAGDAETWEARAPKRAVMEMREGIVDEAQWC